MASVGSLIRILVIGVGHNGKSLRLLIVESVKRSSSCGARIVPIYNSTRKEYFTDHDGIVYTLGKTRFQMAETLRHLGSEFYKSLSEFPRLQAEFLLRIFCIGDIPGILPTPTLFVVDTDLALDNMSNSSADIHQIIPSSTWPNVVNHGRIAINAQTPDNQLWSKSRNEGSLRNSNCIFSSPCLSFDFPEGHNSNDDAANTDKHKRGIGGPCDPIVEIPPRRHGGRCGCLPEGPDRRLSNGK